MPDTSLIKLGQPEQDTWALSRDEASLPETRPAIVPLGVWREHRDDASLAPWLPSDTQLDAPLYDALRQAPLIAIDFPSFTDGRGYSLARLLRERYGYSGEVRAVGDVLVDQLEYMRRCGFTAMALRDDQHPEDALRALSFISVRYQPDVEERQALFERRLADNK